MANAMNAPSAATFRPHQENEKKVETKDTDVASNARVAIHSHLNGRIKPTTSPLEVIVPDVPKPKPKKQLPEVDPLLIELFLNITTSSTQ